MPTPKPTADRYNSIGVGYDNTRKPDPYLANRMFELIQSENPNAKFLDVGCGTGNYTSVLSDMGLSITGIEPSSEMLEKAKTKNPNISWLQGTAENIPITDKSIDGVLVSLTMHHWHDLNKGFSEISRVLKKNGKAVLFTTYPEQTEMYWLNHYFPQMIVDSIAILPTKSAIENATNLAGMAITNYETYSVKPDLQDQFLYCGKHNPELYFEQRIRNGISSFSLLAYENEVETGLRKLRTDIDSGEFNKVAKRYENDLGDYMFVVVEPK